MCGPISNPGGAILCGGFTLLTVAAITLLIVGILGATGSINMSPTAADWMMGLSMAVIGGMIGGVVKVCCCKR